VMGGILEEGLGSGELDGGATEGVVGIRGLEGAWLEVEDVDVEEERSERWIARRKRSLSAIVGCDHRLSCVPLFSSLFFRKLLVVLFVCLRPATDRIDRLDLQLRCCSAV